MTSATVDLNAGDDAFSVRDLTRTLSLAGVLNPAFSRIASARAVSPVPCSESLSETFPASAPAKIARTTNTIQATVAVFQCAALQRPARAARFRFVSIDAPLGWLFSQSADAVRAGVSGRPLNRPLSFSGFWLRTGD